MANGHNKLRDYYYSYIDNDIFFKIDVSSREELQQMEIEEGGEVGAFINWDKWDEIVQRTKEQLEAAEYVTKEGYKCGKEVYAYSFITKELIKKFASATLAAEAYGTSPATILFHARKHKPFQERLYFSLEELDKAPSEDEIVKWVYAFDLKTNELVGRFKTAVEASKHFGLHPTRVGNVLTRQGGMYPKYNLRFSYDKDSGGRPVV